MIRSVVRGIGSYLPEKVLTNARSRRDGRHRRTSGSSSAPESRERHIAAEGETYLRSRNGGRSRALADAGLEARAIDIIVLATSTPDNTFPATAVTVQDRLGIHHGAAFDLQAVCTGFVYALATADALLRTGQGKRALVIGAETFSRILDWSDRATCVLFGDGAGAVVLEAQRATASRSDRGVLTSHLRSDGRTGDKLYVDGGPSTTGTVGHLRMEGREVFKHAVGMITDVIDDCFEATGIRSDDIDWFVPHQANQPDHRRPAPRSSASRAKKVVSTVDRHGNTSAASIPLALDDAADDGRDQARRSCHAGGDGRRLHLGIGARSLVSSPTHC